MYVQRVTVTRFTTRQDRDCSACGKRFAALVATRGEGGGHGSAGWVAAQNRGLEQAKYLVGLARCPGCGQRERRAIVKMLVDWLAVATACVFVFGGFTWVGSMDDTRLRNAIVVALSGVALSTIAIALALRKARRDVQFEDPGTRRQ